MSNVLGGQGNTLMPRDSAPLCSEATRGDALRLRTVTGARTAEPAWVEVSFDRRTVTDADRIRRGAACLGKTIAA